MIDLEEALCEEMNKQRPWFHKLIQWFNKVDGWLAKGLAKREWE